MDDTCPVRQAAGLAAHIGTWLRDEEAVTRIRPKISNPEVWQCPDLATVGTAGVTAVATAYFRATRVTRACAITSRILGCPGRAGSGSWGPGDFGGGCSGERTDNRDYRVNLDLHLASRLVNGQRVPIREEQVKSMHSEGG